MFKLPNDRITKLYRLIIKLEQLFDIILLVLNFFLKE